MRVGRIKLICKVDTDQVDPYVNIKRIHMNLIHKRKRLTDQEYFSLFLLSAGCTNNNVECIQQHHFIPLCKVDTDQIDPYVNIKRIHMNLIHKRKRLTDQG